ncbi:uncharacterized protein LOC129723426 isoform X2 [Wyeomyia smithii]|nr:uncharacterized protein LOC129723426 isoform X2 [Wyeomyia smithii]
MPKAWQDRSSTSTTTAAPPSTTSQAPLDNFNEQTEPQQDLVNTEVPEIPEIPTTTTKTTTQSTTNDFAGYVYTPPADFKSWLKAHMQQSHHFTNQLANGINNLPSLPRGAEVAADCVPLVQLLNRRPSAVSFQTSATIHRFEDDPLIRSSSTTASPPLPFPDNSHHSDIFFQHQKPTPPTPQPPVHQFVPINPQRQTQRFTEFYGNPAYFKQPVLPHHGWINTPVVFNYY